MSKRSLIPVRSGRTLTDRAFRDEKLSYSLSGIDILAYAHSDKSFDNSMSLNTVSCSYIQ